MRTVHFLFISLLLTSACTNNSQTSTTDNKKIDTVIVGQDTLFNDTNIQDLTKIILGYIKKKDYPSLIQFIHPVLGVRFTPYSYVNLKEDVTFSAQELIEMINNDEKILWGLYDGTGEEIKLTTKEYFAKFVYDVDFLNAPKMTSNTSSTAGNSINNIKEIYPDVEYTESYFPGFQKKYEGMDWRALRLVYKKTANKFYLIGVIHDQWTI